MEKQNTKDMGRELAYFRFALIAPVIQGTFPDASVAAYCRRVTEKPIVRPDGTPFQYKPGTLSKWVGLYKFGGMEELMPRARSDRGSTKTLSDEAISEIYGLKEKFPRLNAVYIHGRLVREGLVPATASVRAVQRYIKLHGLKNPAASGPLKDRKAFEEPFFGAMFQADTCYFPYVPDENGKKQRTYLIAIVDDYSRMVVGARLFFADDAYNFQKVFKDAVATHGICNKLYVDHGPSYENSQLSFICGSLGTVLIHAPVRDGAAKAKVERFFGVAKSRWLHGLDTGQIRSIDEFNRELAEAVRAHNLTVNSSTGETPMDRFLATRGKVRTPESEVWLDECFMNRISRKVKNDATLALKNTQFDAPMQFIRQTVEVRFLPGRLDEAYIYDNGKRFPLKLTDKQANSRAKRKDWPTVDYSKEAAANV
ncbi:MAG: DDE-type integrase/transposase/recombinase [Oscillospiraceae bacterium]|jgi:transposase InsO family protein|nr:DDE-type integrase/transposase/recombinase [Oscillospiraceae bacterium]